MPDLLAIFAAASVTSSVETLPALLLGGVVLLTTTLAVLMWTRWGQAHPLAKCAGLSLFAHLLLFCYAYTTCIILGSPESASRGDAMQVRLDDATDDENASPHAAADRPWDQFATADVIPPEVPQPERASDQDEPLERQPADKPPIDAPLHSPLLASPAQLPRDRSPAQVDGPQPEIEELAKSEFPERPNPGITAEGLPEELINPSADIPRRNQAPPVSSIADAAIAESSPPLPTGGESERLPSLPIMTPAALPRRAGDGQAMPAPLQARVTSDRIKIAQQRGGTLQTEAAVAAALEWLAGNQSADGRWDADAHGAGRENKVLGHDRGGAGKNADTGITGLALLAFLGSGETHLEGEHRTTVQAALEFLLASQAENGSLAGSSEFFAAMYCHGIATLALSEAYAMTGDVRLKSGVERAIRYTITSQHIGGGWRYQPHDSGDMSQFGWQVMALKSAEMGGFEIPDETRARMIRFLRSASSGQSKGLASYRPGDRISRTMTAEALVCRIFLSAENSPAAVDEATVYIQEELPRRGAVNLYYWYYGTLAMFQRQDRKWEQWNAALQQELLPLQRLDADQAGSWDPDAVWGGYGGRVYSTAMATLCLEVYYRYLPLYGDGENALQPRWTELRRNRPR